MGRDGENPLAKGFYTVSEAARLIQVGSARRIYGWLRGYPGRSVGPLLVRDYSPIGDEEELSFLDLMEVRFVEHFREYGVKVKSLRIAADTLRRDLSLEHPFATDRVLLVADKADVYVKDVLKKSAEEADDIRLRSLVTNNFVMYEAIKQALLPGVTFDAGRPFVAKWAPIPDKFPQIVMNPKIAYGQPALPRGIPTATLYDAYKAAKRDADSVSYWYDVSTADLRSAIQFEEALDRSLENRAT
jgi:uncharacterized protein (DUF433 family)